jgi:hypothetical protein
MQEHKSLRRSLRISGFLCKQDQVLISQSSQAFSLAKRLGIPNSTFDRISKKGSSKAFIQLCTQNRSRGMWRRERTEASSREYYPNMYEDFSKVYSGNQDVPFVSAEAESLL